MKFTKRELEDLTDALFIARFGIKPSESFKGDLLLLEIKLRNQR